MSDELKKSLEIIQAVCAAFKGSLQEHQHVQAAILSVKLALEELGKTNKEEV